MTSQSEKCLSTLIQRWQRGATEMPPESGKLKKILTLDCTRRAPLPVFFANTHLQVAILVGSKEEAAAQFFRRSDGFPSLAYDSYPQQSSRGFGHALALDLYLFARQRCSGAIIFVNKTPGNCRISCAGDEAGAGCV
jgi:hypothetical protein